jgi:hypothetical protein
MAEVIVSSQDLTVLGGPATVNLEVDFGKQGQRGSQIFGGLGPPSLDNIPQSQTLQVGDMYINIDPNDPGYSYVSQYTADGWVDFFRLVPLALSVNKTLTFSEYGVASLVIPLDQYLEESVINALDADSINVQFSMESPAYSQLEVPDIIASSITAIVISNNPLNETKKILTVAVSGARFDVLTNTWSTLTGECRAQFVISLAINADPAPSS